MALITRSGDVGARAWSENVNRAEAAELRLRLLTERLETERRRGHQLFSASVLASNLLSEGKTGEAQSQLRVAIIAGRRRP